MSPNSATLIRTRAAQRVKNRQHLDEHICVKCGNSRFITACDSRRTDLCRQCSLKRTHGHSHKDPRYYVWANMKQRTMNPGNPGAKNYGLRGIGLCEKWVTYEGFMEWERFDEWKPGLQIDRIDNDRGYHPENCRWVSRSVNNQNKRTTKLTPRDVKAIRLYRKNGTTIAEIANLFGVSATHVVRIAANQKWKNI